MVVQGCAVRCPLTGCQVTSRSRDRFSGYSKWLDTFRTDLAFNTLAYQSKTKTMSRAFAEETSTEHPVYLHEMCRRSVYRQQHWEVALWGVETHNEGRHCVLWHDESRNGVQPYRKKKVHGCNYVSHLYDCTRTRVCRMKERDHLGDPGVDGRIKLRRIFRNWYLVVWAGPSYLRVGTGGGLL